MTTELSAMQIAGLNGRDWSDMGAYEREQYMDEARKVECDCCGQKFAIDEVSFIPADRAGAAQCDTTACEACRSLPA